MSKKSAKACGTGAINQRHKSPDCVAKWAKFLPRQRNPLSLPLYSLPHVLHCKTVSDPHPARYAEREDKRTFLQKIVEFIHPGLASKDELIETLAEAEDNEVIGTEARVMLEGVIRMADRNASDIMVAAPRMDVLDIDAPYDEMLVQVIRNAHSRFPVFEGERDNIIGILMAKDLLKLQRSPALNVRALLRPVVFTPETKGLYDLLREFRTNRNHMSILIDEFGHVAGLVTMEDVLEEIVGEIEDEFDVPEENGDIFALADDTYRVAGHTPLERLEEAFNVSFAHEEGADEFDTIGGWVSHAMGHSPKRGEMFEAAGLQLVVLHSKGGAVRWFQVTRAEDSLLHSEAA